MKTTKQIHSSTPFLELQNIISAKSAQLNAMLLNCDKDFQALDTKHQTNYLWLAQSIAKEINELNSLVMDASKKHYS